MVTPHEHVGNSKLSIRDTLRVIILMLLCPFQSKLKLLDSFIKPLQKSKGNPDIVVRRKEVLYVCELLVLQMELKGFAYRKVSKHLL